MDTFATYLFFQSLVFHMQKKLSITVISCSPGRSLMITAKSIKNIPFISLNIKLMEFEICGESVRRFVNNNWTLSPHIYFFNYLSSILKRSYLSTSFYALSGDHK